MSDTTHPLPDFLKLEVGFEFEQTDGYGWSRHKIVSAGLNDRNEHVVRAYSASEMHNRLWTAKCWQRDVQSGRIQAAVNIYSIEEKLRRLVEKQEAFHFQLRQLEVKLWKLQVECKHPDAISAYDERDRGGIPEIRVCGLCGYAEEGWGSPLRFNPDNYINLPRIAYPEAMKLVRTLVRRSDFEALGWHGKERALEALKEKPSLKPLAESVPKVIEWNLALRLCLDLGFATLVLATSFLLVRLAFKISELYS